jgi:hypothetical protein
MASTRSRSGSRELHRLSPEQLNRAKLFVNQEVEILSDTPRAVVLSVPLRHRWWNGPFVRSVLSLRMRKTFELDARGRSFLKRCDGEREVAQIIREFGEEYDLTPQEARVAVASFAQLLLHRGIVVMVGTESESRRDGARS